MAETSKGKAAAVKALTERRAQNKNIKRVDNSSLHAGSPMYFYCIACNAPIVLPENYIPPRRKLCYECEAMNELGWLE